MYITIDNLFCIIFLKFLVIFIFVIIILVQFYVFYLETVCFIKKHRSSKFITIFYYVIDTVYIYSWKIK